MIFDQYVYSVVHCDPSFDLGSSSSNHGRCTPFNLPVSLINVVDQHTMYVLLQYIPVDNRLYSFMVSLSQEHYHSSGGQDEQDGGHSDSIGEGSMMVEILESEVWLFKEYFFREPDALCDTML